MQFHFFRKPQLDDNYNDIKEEIIRELLRISQQFSTFLITSALVSTLVPLHSNVEAQISHLQLQGKSPKIENFRSQQKQVSRIHLLKKSVKLMELGVPQRRVSAGSR